MGRLNELNDHHTLQVDLLNQTILNIMSTVVPKTIRTKPFKPDWLTRGSKIENIKNIKNMRNMRNIENIKKYKKYKKYKKI